MSRNGLGVYSLPSVYEAVPGETIEAVQHNTPLEDLAQDANTARPVVAGGTGATTAQGAVTSLFEGTSTVRDDRLLIADPSDATKRVRLDAGNVATATTRVLSMPDIDISLGETLLSRGTAASGATSLDIAIPPGFTIYRLLIWSQAPASGTAIPFFRFSVDGSTYLSAGYSWVGHQAVAESATDATSGSTSASAISVGATSNNAVGVFDCMVVTNIGTIPYIRGTALYPTGSGATVFNFGGFHTTNSALTNVRFIYSAGNIGSAGAKYTLIGVL